MPVCIIVFSNYCQRWQYEKLGILKYQSFNLLRCSFNVKMFKFSNICPIFYIACYQLAFLIIRYFYLSICCNSFFPSWLCAKGWKALWQNLVGTLARYVLTMCLLAKGRYVFPYPNYSYTAFEILCHCLALFTEYTIKTKTSNKIPLVIT
mgnify:FL=1